MITSHNFSCHSLSTYLRIVFCLSIFINTCFNHGAEADDPPDYSSDYIISRINETYNKVHSAQGRITRTIEVDKTEIQRHNGRFAVRKPEHILIEFVGEFHQFVGFDGTTFRIYFPNENKGIFQKNSDMSPLERFILGPEPFFGNIFTVLKQGFSIKVADRVDGNIILKATPNNPVNFNFILVSVDPKTWTIQAIEHFDRTNTLVSQTKFLEYKTVGDSLFFPTKMATSNIISDAVRVETTRLTRVQLNIPIDDETFSIPASDDTEWTSNDKVE